MMNKNITFSASFIQRVPIKKYSPENNSYTKTDANFVELNSLDSRDIFALGNVTQEFDGDSFANNIFQDAKMTYKRKKADPDMHIYALTNQKDNFERLEADEVLGLAEITDAGDESAEIEYLQVHPKLIMSLESPQFKYVGSAILDCLKEYYNKINLRSSASSTNFYKKNEFEETKPRVFVWRKDK